MGASKTLFTDTRQLGAYLEAQQELDQYHKRMIDKRRKSMRIRKLFNKAFKYKECPFCKGKGYAGNISQKHAKNSCDECSGTGKWKII